MPNSMKKIRIVKNGPYMVTGNIHISEKIIHPTKNGSEFQEGRPLPQNEEYALCRCGKSKNAPFCDDSHQKNGFQGQEVASREKYENRAEFLQGPDLDLLDDNRCAYARFCHSAEGNVWEILENTDDPQTRATAIRIAGNCPSGRLVAVDKDGKQYEPEYEPAIEIISDPANGVESGIFVKGNIQIESADGVFYEKRSRVMLCRCGKSRNKPFCDASHIPDERTN